MKTELILKSDVLDILFENRNKAYGAYHLRKFYNNRLIKSIAVMLGLVIVLSAFTFIPKKKTSQQPEEITIPHSFGAPQKKEEQPKEKPKPKPQPQQQPVVSMKKHTNNIVITPNDVRTDTIEAIDPKDFIGTTNIKGSAITGVVTIPIVPPATGGGGEGPEEPTPVKVDINTPIHNPDVMPSYPGGMEALKKFLERNLNNPRDMEEGEMVSVRVKFVVGFDGKLKAFETIQDGGEEFNKEVIRVLKKMPEWVPGKSNGQNVSVYYTVPVKFIPGN
jgi:periplasmic protein TonB